ncbi:MAG TPA: alpha/beta hydrolase [Rhodocyclaceae bacterium]|nr:MAG: alpha/beta hydrolase [Rhodocyclales bacterium CG_4_10_14_3_um_filter_68_10]PJA58004.1 MAG: alpha/beta hydrolase [Rhodocyclales bacterium CG_4_9_14_3_um_filter_68_10]HCX32209.1 alpha/beta hydrolase [Rhodocyclaceae bacterium]
MATADLPEAPGGLQRPPLQRVRAGGHMLEYRLHPACGRDAPTLVMLHEGLGSVAMWRDFPSRVAAATGCPTLVYSRYGYGGSDRLEEPRGVRYMHDEALVALPELLDELHIARPILIGHSDGASIALIHAGDGRREVAGLVLMAPHVFVEDLSVASIAKAKIAWETTDLPRRLARYHDDAERSFRGWNDIWLHPDFRAWNITGYLSGIRCPILALQGMDDEYGTMAQVETIAAHCRDVEILKLADCRHSAHRDQPEATLAAIRRFVTGG